MAQARRRRSRPPGYTTRAGLGSDHQKERVAQLRTLGSRPGTCPRCGGVFYGTLKLAASAGLPPKFWYVDLDDFPGRRFGGPQVKLLAHRYCNRRAGQRVTTAILRGRSTKTRAAYNRWL